MSRVAKLGGRNMATGPLLKRKRIMLSEIRV